MDYAAGMRPHFLAVFFGNPGLTKQIVKGQQAEMVRTWSDGQHRMLRRSGALVNSAVEPFSQALGTAFDFLGKREPWMHRGVCCDMASHFWRGAPCSAWPLGMPGGNHDERGVHFMVLRNPNPYKFP